LNDAGKSSGTSRRLDAIHQLVRREIMRVVRIKAIKATREI
jgi:hypothetical protein